jgi:hypothetical protein
MKFALVDRIEFFRSERNEVVVQARSIPLHQVIMRNYRVQAAFRIEKRLIASGTVALAGRLDQHRGKV